MYDLYAKSKVFPHIFSIFRDRGPPSMGVVIFIHAHNVPDMVKHDFLVKRALCRKFNVSFALN